ncbi:TPA: DUF2528 family protein [Salmonella enterica]|nr:DUF2528 family protein [Salmonella enterica]HEA0369855.1 DUF2528 family protein [Salmonella enterica]HEA2144714.1 DUF2528 family protein [Salmonella enterica]HEA2153457.1 DUF2528 family protein [Salmonella enterica]
MSDVKCYEITWNARKDVPVLTVEIDPAVCTIGMLEDINKHFFKEDELITNTYDDFIATALKVIAITYFTEKTQPTRGWDSKKITFGYNEEGNSYLPSMDGCSGIRILCFTGGDFDLDDLKVKKIS